MFNLIGKKMITIFKLNPYPDLCKNIEMLNKGVELPIRLQMCTLVHTFVVHMQQNQVFSGHCTYGKCSKLLNSKSSF